MRVNDAITGAVLIALAVGAGLQARTFPSPPGQIYGAWFFPMVLAFALGATGLLLVARGLATLGSVSWFAEPSRNVSARSLVDAATLPILVVFYVQAVDRIGFVPAAAVVVFVLAVRLGTRPISAGALAIAASLVVSQIFGRVLRVPLPTIDLGPFSV